MNKFFKNRALPFTCILNFYIRLVSVDAPIIGNDIKFFYEMMNLSTPKKYNSEKKFFEFSRRKVLVYLDRSKIDFFVADSSFKLKVAGGSIRVLYLKPRDMISDEERISSLSDQDILGGFSIKEEWTSLATLGTEKSIKFPEKSNCQLTEDHIWKGNNSGTSSDEEMIAMINKTTLADLGLTLGLERNINYILSENDPSSFVYFVLEIRLINDGVRGYKQRMFIFNGDDATILENLENIWNNLQSYKDRFNGEPTINSGGNNPENHETPFSEEGGSEGTAERPYSRMKIDIYILVLIFFAFILGLVMVGYFFRVKKKSYVTKRSTSKK